MALVADYVTLTDLKAHLRITDTADDVILAVQITAASRAVDQFTGRRFGQGDSATDRLFTWHGEMVDGCQLLIIDDTASITSLAVDIDQDYTYSQELVLGTDFDMYPYNASEDGTPWTGVVLRTTAAAPLVIGARRVQVTALWGWAAVPSVVEIATLIQAARYFARRDSPYGIAGSPELGSEVRLLANLDPDVQQLLQSVARTDGWVA